MTEERTASEWTPALVTISGRVYGGAICRDPLAASGYKVRYIARSGRQKTWTGSVIINFTAPPPSNVILTHTHRTV